MMQGPVKVLQVMTSLRFASPLLDNTFEKYGSCKTHKGGGGGDEVCLGRLLYQHFHVPSLNLF